MKFEQAPAADGGEEKSSKLETSKRLMLALEPTRLNFSKMELTGEEHLAEIPPGAKIVIAVDHLNNLSIPTAALMMGKRLPIMISNQSTQFSIKENPQGHLGVAVGGKDNFAGIDYDAKTDKPKPFNPENFESMSEPLEEGYAMIVAAHNPVKSDRLPEKGGYGAAYLAGIEDAYILPVSVNIKSKEGVRVAQSQKNLLKNLKDSIGVLLERPEAEITIGVPHKVSHAEDIKTMHSLFMKRKETGRLSIEEQFHFSRLRESLNAASDEIMDELAKMLPEEKRGVWLQREKKAESVDAG